MPDNRYDALITRARGFFTELAANNTKEFFEPRKAFYNAEIKRPAEDLAADIAAMLGDLTGRAHKAKLFRIYRDVRFSKDKTPYNAHLHLMWTPVDGAGATWFFGAAPDYVVLGTGLMGMDGATLDRYRAFVAQDGAVLMADIAGAGGKISDWGPPPLKRVPKPYQADHPQAELLKRKALAFHVDLANIWEDKGMTAAISDAAKAILPAHERLTKVLA